MNALSEDKSVDKILLVEDNPVSSKIQTKLLSNKGFNVDAVSNGHDALEAVKGKEYALILMDINMPILNGYDASKLIRMWQEQEMKYTMPIVALTAHDIPDDKKIYEDSGINHFIKKPLEDEDIEYISNLMS